MEEKFKPIDWIIVLVIALIGFCMFSLVAAQRLGLGISNPEMVEKIITALISIVAVYVGSKFK